MANKGFVNPDTKIMADDPVQPYIMDVGGVTDAVGAHIADIIDDRAEEIFTDEKENTFREVKRLVGSVLPEVMADDIDQIVANDEIMDGLSSRLVNYSTTEKRIGTWNDKPLYQKTYIISDLTKNAWTSYDFDNNGDDIVNFAGGYINSDKRMRPFGTYISSSEFFYIDVLPNRCSYKYNASDSGMSIILHIQYTKTAN